MRDRPTDPVAVVPAADVLSWTIRTVAKFPRNLRYGLGGRIEGALTDVLEGLVTAQYGRGGVRRDALEHANRRLQVARYLARIAVSNGALSERQGFHPNVAKRFRGSTRQSASDPAARSRSRPERSPPYVRTGDGKHGRRWRALARARTQFSRSSPEAVCNIRVHLASRMIELGAQVGGWRKASDARVSSSPA